MLPNTEKGYILCALIQKEEAGRTIDIIDRFGNQFEQQHGSRIAYASDEFYLIAERPIPSPEFYGDFSQIESGVGAMACLKDEFLYALEERLDGQETLEIRKDTLHWPQVLRLIRF